MYPAITVGSMVFSSNIPACKNGDVVIYKGLERTDIPSSEEVPMACRIVASAGEMVEMKNGIFYKNNRIADDTLKIGFFFRVAVADVNAAPLSKLDPKLRFPTEFSDTVLLNVTYIDMYRLVSDKQKIKRVVYEYRAIHPGLFGAKGDSLWSAENFGPVVVPADHFFLMGDNRVNSLDSRYRGFIPAEKIVATILNVD